MGRRSAANLPAALVFDFDGLVCDTESIEYESVRRIYADHGAALTLDAWLPAVGAASAPDWVAALEAEVGRALDRADLVAARQAHGRALAAGLPCLPGVLELLDEALAAGVACGVASNSPAAWVHGHLDRLGLARRFAVVVTVDAVERPKPHPEPYLTVAAALGAEPADAAALEDSGIGVASAHAAGLYTVAVPGPMSRHHDVSGADLVVDSLAELTLARLGAGMARRRRP